MRLGGTEPGQACIRERGRLAQFLANVHLRQSVWTQHAQLVTGSGWVEIPQPPRHRIGHPDSGYPLGQLVDFRDPQQAPNGRHLRQLVDAQAVKPAHELRGLRPALPVVFLVAQQRLQDHSGIHHQS